MEGFLNPEEVLKKLNLRADMIAADFGSGSGGWAIPLARTLQDGKVFAIDVLEEPLSALQGRAALLHISNIETQRRDLESEKGSSLESESLDLVLLTNLLFEIEKRRQVLAEANRVLKGSGKALIVDWKKDSLIGPREGKVSPEEVKNLVKGLNFRLEQEFEASNHHWGLIFQKP